MRPQTTQEDSNKEKRNHINQWQNNRINNKRGKCL